MGDSVPPTGLRGGEVDCTAPVATAGSGGPSWPGTIWLRVGLARVWLNGRELGGADPRYAHLEASHD